MSDRLVTNHQMIRYYYDSGVIVNADSLCPECRLRHKKRNARTCEVCEPTVEREQRMIRELVSRPAESGSFHTPLVATTTPPVCCIQSNRGREQTFDTTVGGEEDAPACR